MFMTLFSSGIYLTTSNSQGTDVTISTTTVGYYSLVITDAKLCRFCCRFIW